MWSPAVKQHHAIFSLRQLPPAILVILCVRSELIFDFWIGLLVIDSAVHFTSLIDNVNDF